MKLFKTLVVLVLVGMAIAAAVIWSGIYNVGADDPHWSATHRALEVARKRSIAVRAADIHVPDLSDAERTRLRRDHIGIVYQAASLFPSLTAREQVRLVAHISGNLNDTTKKRADELLERVGLTDRADARPAELSGGERQRVGIARALMGSPSVLLADEPTAALDAERGVAIMDLLTENATSMGIATVVVTHAPDQLEEDRTFSIGGGRLAEVRPKPSR